MNLAHWSFVWCLRVEKRFVGSVVSHSMSPTTEFEQKSTYNDWVIDFQFNFCSCVAFFPSALFRSVAPTQYNMETLIFCVVSLLYCNSSAPTQANKLGQRLFVYLITDLCRSCGSRAILRVTVAKHNF